MRTTSSLEASNSVLNRSITKKTNYFKFFERMQTHESRCADRMYNLVHDLLPEKHFEPRHKVDQERAKKININTTLLCKGEMTPAKFLDEMTSDETCTLLICDSVF